MASTGLPRAPMKIAKKSAKGIAAAVINDVKSHIGDYQGI